MSNRTTVIIGAGLPLNLCLPADKYYPSTKNITKQTCLPYPDYSKFNQHNIPQTDIVNSFYQFLVKNYPIVGSNNPLINFEQVFHCMEEYWSYTYSWDNNCFNTDICPVFGTFTKPSIVFDRNELSAVIPQFLMRIMDIINKYDSYFQSELNGKEKWLTDFFKGLPTMDVFNFNYDNIIENILGEGNYNDGFIPTTVSNEYKVFSPKELFENSTGLPTVNHLHGNIKLYHVDNSNNHIKDLRHEDWVKYQDYNKVRSMMIGRSQSQPHTQAGETIYNGPIITGLNKTAKLNCIPFDFYHANLVNSINSNHKLLIIGYSFGDLYCNQIIQRMNLIHGDKARVCIIDYMDTGNNDKRGFIEAANLLNQDLGRTLCIYSDKNMFEEALLSMSPLDRTKMMKSPSGKLMLGVDGLKTAASHATEIYRFLNS